MNVQPFNATAKWMSITAPNGSASASQALPAQGAVIHFKNVGSGLVYISVGSGTQIATPPGSTAGTATATSLPVQPGEVDTYTIDSTAILNISVYGAAASTLLVAVGEGQ